MRALASIAFAVVAAAAALALALFAAQRRLLYFPERVPLDAAARAARALRLAPWTGPEGGFVGWRAPHPGASAAGRAIVLHGNAGSALDRTYLRDVLQGARVPPLEVFLLEYPGYGPRPGVPTEASVVGAAREAIALLRREGGGPVVLVGESLGSAAAALAAAERPGDVAGVLLLTPLASVSAVARRHYPGVPAFLVRDRFRADLALPRYGGPVAFLIAGHDEIVFADLGRALFEAYPGPKRLWVQERATHNGLAYRADDPAWAEMVGFLLRAER